MFANQKNICIGFCIFVFSKTNINEIGDMKYDVTIGIPVFQAVDYIIRSLDSALNQSYDSIEFLIIDDGSQDGSVDVIRQIVNSHPRGEHIHLFVHSSNMGVSFSRNEIIDQAEGEFLFFMDSDDIISKDTISLMMEDARRYDAEIVFGSYEKIETSGERTVYQYPSLQFLRSCKYHCLRRLRCRHLDIFLHGAK